MAELIVIRLTPPKPVDPDTFATYLTGLTVEAYDLTYGTVPKGTLIGSALYKVPSSAPPYGVPPGPGIYPAGTGIVQHIVQNPPPPAIPIDFVTASVATAVIAVGAPTTFENLRIVIKRGGQTWQVAEEFYNVQTDTGAPTPDQFQSLGITSCYLTVPAVSSGGIGLSLPTDGSAPAFEPLVAAIKQVLNLDPGGPPPALASLTPEQCKNIAYEIVWGTQTALPAPPESLEDMYTDPPNTGKTSDSNEQDLLQFQGALSAYYAPQDANAIQLATYVYSAAAAYACQNMSLTAQQALFALPVDAGISLGGPLGSIEVLLINPGGGALPVNFGVPAAYFYALSAIMPSQVTAQQRYNMACGGNAAQLLTTLTQAVTNATISDDEQINGVGAHINPAQAVRRLAALNVEGSANRPLCPVDVSISDILNDWLGYGADWPDPTVGPIEQFWITPGVPPTPATDEVVKYPGKYLDFVLTALTQGYTPPASAQSLAQLILAHLKITPNGSAPPTTVAQLAQALSTDWANFFTSSPGGPANQWLPPFTGSGSAQARLSALIIYIQQFFSASPPAQPTNYSAANPSAPPLLVAPSSDWISQVIAAYALLPGGGPITLGSGFDAVVMAQAAAQIFPDDLHAQEWLVQAITTLDALAAVVNPLGVSASLAFSLMEALYARGFKGANDILPLSLDEFETSLIGTIAYSYAATIFSNIGGNTNPAPQPGPFNPVNPGDLVNCLPAPCSSPLGEIEYLHELLTLAQTASCENPSAAPASGQLSLGDALATRRGPLATVLLASCPNLEIPIPLIDIVNENLESLVTTIPSQAQGAVYNTNGATLNGYTLCEVACCPPQGEPIEACDDCQDPVTLYGAVPAYSSPAVPVALPGAYDKLAHDFATPDLPYSQMLDINRTYLEHLCTTRYDTMRRFRRDITEFVHDETLAAPIFQSHLWRYPLNLDLTLEYLCLTQQELDAWTGERARPNWALFGFNSASTNKVNWVRTASQVSEFLARTGLNWCELRALQDCGIVSFTFSGSRDGKLPACEPCYPGQYLLSFGNANAAASNLGLVGVFIRIWRKLQCCGCIELSMNDLADIFAVVAPTLTPTGNLPDFLRQLASILLLHREFHLALRDRSDHTIGTGADRLHILALWVGPTAAKWNWAIQQLLHGVRPSAQRHHGCTQRSAQFIKLLAQNLDPLSQLMGFDPASAGMAWSARPTSTLRFAELLAKLYASPFSVGELLYLFGAQAHLDGDDPYPLQTDNEALDDPLDLPDEQGGASLWALRHALLEVDVDEKDAAHWNWNRISASLRDDFGYVPLALNDPWQSLGEHFFPHMLGASLAARQFSVMLGGSNPLLWNTPIDGPFQYSGGKLWTQIPLRDEAVIEKLSNMAELINPAERLAVQNLYFSPRLMLAPFAFLFENYAAAERVLIETANEHERWAFFQRQFALARARCHCIAEHLAAHAAREALDNPADDERHPEHKRQVHTAWAVLRNLLADENRGKQPWENDAGTKPDFTWKPLPNGGSFAALLGLTGTGLLGEYSIANSNAIVWSELRGPMSAFDYVRDRHNAPQPTVIPALDATLGTGALQHVVLHNGFARNDDLTDLLGGVQGFKVMWSGVLLVEESGDYHFMAGAPTPDGEVPSVEVAERRRWRVTLQRGQRTWIVLHHQWDEQQEHARPQLALQRGAYNITVEFTEPPPDIAAGCDDETDESLDGSAEQIRLRHFHTGFQVKYKGPDSGQHWEALPLCRLYQQQKTGLLDQHIKQPDVNFDVLSQYLETLYSSSLRDIRRTYQRAFKATLFACRFGLSAERMTDTHQSELGYMLANPALFEGRSYYLNGGSYQAHNAGFDFNLLPLLDNYLAPDVTIDDRVAPSLQRRQALFDWWERCFDYLRMRKSTHAATARPAWLLFYDAQEQQPANPAWLLRHIDVDQAYAAALLQFYDHASNQVDTLTFTDLEDERWALRVWHADVWMRAVLKAFAMPDPVAALPCLWASDDPSLILAGQTVSGNSNLVDLVQAGEFAHDSPRRYDALRRMNDCLRERSRHALLSYLTVANRVPLPWGGFASTNGDISALLLLDVNCGICEKASRIEEAITAVQSFVRRARLGLEPAWQVQGDFARFWDKQFASFDIWLRCKQRLVYRENWMEWAEQAKASKIEAYQLLNSELRRNTLSIAVPGGLEWWPDQTVPEHAGLMALQEREPSQLHQFVPREGLGLQGLPDRDGRLSWLAPLDNTAPNSPPPPSTNLPGRLVKKAALSAAAQSTSPQLPFWLEAAVKMGRRFYRIVAAGEAMGGHPFAPATDSQPKSCCACCGQMHAPLNDEYYFWLEPGQLYLEPLMQGGANVAPQNFQYGFQDDLYDANHQESTLWQAPAQIPQLLEWTPQPVVILAWTRLHNGQFLPPRHAETGVPVSDPQSADLQFLGRQDDSLTFSVSGALPAQPGYNDPSLPGFRYDLAPDRAVTLPLVQAANSTGMTYPGGLHAYPYFVYAEPGASLFPTSLYAPALAVACVQRAHCHYESAIKWLQLVFDPLHMDNTWMRCHRAAQNGNNSDEAGVTLTHVGAGNALEGCCNSSGVSDLVARNRSVLMHVLETFMEWGDALMRRNTPESFQQARLLLDTANMILGPRPPDIVQAASTTPATIGAFVPGFAPLNPALLGLYDKVADRRALIHHCENLRRLHNGTPNCDMPYFGEPCPGDGCCPAITPCPGACDDDCNLSSPYRFEFLIAKAQALSAKVRELGAALLAAFEKGDAEYLAGLHSRFENEINNLNLAVREDQWRDADWQIEALQKTKLVSQTNLLYYSNLLQAGLIPDEIQYQDLTEAAMVTRAAGNTIEAIGEVIKLVPDVFVGQNNFVQLPIGTKLSGMFEAIARILNVVADIENTNASLDNTNAGWERRAAEWLHQTQVLPIEIHQIEVQILGAQRRRDSALRELNIQQRQIGQSKEILDFTRDKFSSDALYLYLQKETSALYYQAFSLGLQVALQAQRAFHRERGDDKRRFIPSTAWDSLREGLLAGDKLDLALSRMEQTYHDENLREYELSKNFSLRLHFPLAYLQLRATGRCTIELPEWMFDADYPGMYMRRIKNVSLTVPCITGPYTGVHCKLTLLSSVTRVDPRLKPAPHRCCGQECDWCYESCCSDDPRLQRRYAATEAIATSTGQNDTGLFEMNFHDERYLPFEFHGAVSRWRIELPAENNQFDFNTLSDLVLRLNFTAREGGELLRCEALRCAREHLPGDGWSLLEVRHEFPNAWTRFVQGAGRNERGGPSHRNLDLELRRNQFPFVQFSPDILLGEFAVLFETSVDEEHHEEHEHECGCARHCDAPDEHMIQAAWLPPARHDRDIDHYQDIRCLSSNEWPCLYHGVHKLPQRRLQPEESHTLRLRFAIPQKVTRVFVLCRYRSNPHCSPCHNPLLESCRQGDCGCHER